MFLLVYNKIMVQFQGFLTDKKRYYLEIAVELKNRTLMAKPEIAFTCEDKAPWDKTAA